VNPFEDPKYRDFTHIKQFVADLAASMAKGEVDPQEFAELIRVIVSPEDKEEENRHDITEAYKLALYARGEDEIADCLDHVDLILVGMNMAVGLRGHHGRRFDPDHISESEAEAMIWALRAVLRLHGMPVEVEGNRLCFRPGVETDPWLDAINEFREELEHFDDPFSKWYKPKEED